MVVALVSSITMATALHAGGPLPGPTGTVSAPPVAANTAATVTALLQDDIAVLGATLFYRVAGDPAFTSAAMTQVTAGTWTAVIPPGAVTVRGVQYYVQATDGLNVSTFPAGAPTSGTGSLSVTLTSHPVFTLVAGEYALLGVPLVPSETDPAAVFDELGPYVPARWRHFTFDAGASAYREHPASGDVAPGRGFWIIAVSGASIRVSGTSANVGQDFSITLAPGFNQIASPFAFPVAFADVVRPGGVENNLIGFDGSGYVPRQTVLEPGRGYWIRNTSNGDRVIRIPARGPAERPATEPMAAPAPGGWRLVARASAGLFTDLSNEIGMRPDATSTQDAFDFTEPPVAPGGHVVLAFLSEAGPALMADHRGVEGGQTWEMRLASDQAGAPYRVDLEIEGALPAGFEVAMFERETGARVSLAEGAALTGVVGEGGWSRRWVVVAGPPEYVAARGRDVAEASPPFRVGLPYPNPLRAARAATVELELSAPAPVSVTVHDLQGRVLRRLHEGMLEQGLHRIAWSGDGEGHRALPAGIYFLRVDAGAGRRVDRKLILIGPR